MTPRWLRAVWRWRPIVSVRAYQPEGCRLHVLPGQGALEVSHRLPIPPAICPVSRNPVSGQVTITYQPAAVVAEVVSLHQLIEHGARHEARNVEGLAKWVHGECRRALGVPVEVVLTLMVRPGPQIYTVRFSG